MKISVKSIFFKRKLHTTLVQSICIKMCYDCPAIYNVEQQTKSIIPSIYPSIHPQTNTHISGREHAHQ